MKATTKKNPLAIHLTEVGNLTGPPILFIHAFPMTERMWDEQIRVLENDYRVVTLDIRGFGKSKLDHPYTLEFAVDDVIALMDHLHIEKAVLCGLSMGGYISLRAVLRNPERFNGLILANTKSEPDSDAAKLDRYKGIQTIEEKGLEVFIEGFLGKALAPKPEGTKSTTFLKTQKIAMSNAIDGVEAGLLALISRTDTTADLGKIKISTLILHGELDSVIPLETAKVLSEKIPASQFHVIPNAGHLSNLDNPENFNGKMIEFLKGLKLRI